MPPSSTDPSDTSNFESYELEASDCELFAGDRAIVRTQLLDADRKRVHYVHSMYAEPSGEVVATNECLGMNISLDTRRSAPFALER